MRQSLFPSSLQQLKSGTFHEYIPLSETSTSRTSTSSMKRATHRWRDGYHFGVLCCATTAGTVLFINVVLMIVVGATYSIKDGIGTFQDGDCAVTKRMDLWLHLLINVLSTLLLGASNYSMQCLSAPTRQDIDVAHSENKWMDIGVPSIKNVFRISWTRKVLWCLLFLSSVPVHLMYNSVVFSSTSATEWTAFSVTSDFLTGAPFSTERGPVKTVAEGNGPRLAALQNSTSLVRLENKDCLAAYSGAIISAWGDVLLVSTAASTNNSLIYTTPMESDPTEGQGGGPLFCRLVGADDCANTGNPDPSNWTLRNATSNESVEGAGTVSHCMAQPAEQHCKMRFSMPLIGAVVACNIIKLFCMGIIVWKLDPRPLVTIGDAIASFLDRPDATTAGNCLATKAAFKKGSLWKKLPAEYHRRRRMWFASASKTRWITTTALCAITLIIAIVLLDVGASNIDSPFSLGFGAIDVSATISAQGLNGDILSSILVANSPQLLLSFLYFAYNGLWTCMLLAQEWSEYANKRKPLRVTSPNSGQRSTYRLQLPYRYGIPLLIVSGFLHWLVSQSIFLVIIDAYTWKGVRDSEDRDTMALCGYSPVAILVTVIAGSIVLITGIANGFRHYPNNGMPLAGSCSAAISAACHPPAGDDRASRKSVMWGACGSAVDGDWDRVVDVGDTAYNAGKESLRQQGGGDWREDVKVGHCSFSSFTVEEPIEGQLYAGVGRRET